MKRVLVVKKSMGWSKLVRILSNHPAVSRLYLAETTKKAGSILNNTRIDMVFAFQERNDDGGLDLLRRLDRMIHVVIISFCPDLAVFAYEINALDFICQPVSKSRLALTMKRIEKKHPIRTIGFFPDLKWRTYQKIAIKGANRDHFVAVKQITAITASGGNYTSIHLRGGMISLLRKSLVYWEFHLPGSIFFRIHRSAIINITKIKYVDKKRSCCRVRLYHINDYFHVSRRKRKAFYEKLEQLYTFVRP